MGGGPGYAEIAFGSVWVGNHQGESISRIDPATNAVTATIPVPGEPTGITAALGAIWTYTPLDRRLKRIDPATNAVVGELELEDQGGSITGVAELDGFIWMAGESGALRKIDPEAMAEAGSVRVRGGCAGSVTAAAGRLWYAPLCGGTGVSVIDPVRMVVEAEIAVPQASAVWAGLDAVWASSLDGTVTKIDPNTRTVVATGKAGPRAEQIRTGAGAVWVRVDGHILVRMDPSSLTTVRSYALPFAPIPGGGFAVDDDAVWAVNFGDATVWRMAP